MLRDAERARLVGELDRLGLCTQRSADRAGSDSHASEKVVRSRVEIVRNDLLALYADAERGSAHGQDGRRGGYG